MVAYGASICLSACLASQFFIFFSLMSGARVVISHPLGRQVLEQQRQEFPDRVISDLPDKMTLEKVAAAHSFEISEYVDKAGYYLAVLKFNGV